MCANCKCALKERKCLEAVHAQIDQNVKQCHKVTRMGRTSNGRARLVLLMANVCTIFLTDLNRLTTRVAAARYQASNQQRARLLASPAPSEQTSALMYLQKYGYMQAPANNLETNNLVSEESFSGAVIDFQRFAGLPQTGLVDNRTLELMRLPRCGNSDKWRPFEIANLTTQHGEVSKNGGGQRRRRQLSRSEVNSPRRRKRYALQGSKWRRQELTYRISQYPSRFSGKRQEVDAQIERAFGIWSQVAPIDFVVKKEGRVHIDIRFASGDHGDGDAFDGPGNTLAHAYFPQYGGDAHFDDQEYWTIDSYAGTNIFQVAAHELGHSLGLGHSNVREALMAPFYQKYKPHFKLHADDILAIQALYGEKPPGLEPASSSSSPASTTVLPPPSAARFPGIYKGGTRRPTPSTTTTTTSTTTTAATPTLGSSPVAGDESDERENGIPDLSSNGLSPGGNPFNSDDPSVLANGPGSSHGPGLSGSGLFPAQFPAALPADLCSDGAIDAITRTEDGNTYVFKGDFYWLLVSDGLAKNYPRRISLDWEGLPGNLDAALTWADGKTFFFKGNKYWRFKNKRRDLGYPKLISAGFAGIPDDLDAALVWSGNGRTYFFKGAEYWRFDSKAEPPVSSEYPRPMRVWLGVPAHLNAAFKWENNVTYFFKSNQYYRFNDNEFRVEARGRPAFPRQTAEWWFGCVSSNLAQRALPAAAANWRHQAPQQPQQLVETGASWPIVSGGGGTLAKPQRQQATSGGNTDDWSLLAGLSEDSTRLLGTHISDHSRPTTQAASSSASEIEAGGQQAELAPGLLADGQAEPRTDAPASVGRHSPAGGRPSLSEPSNWRQEEGLVQNAYRPFAGGSSASVPQTSSHSSSSAILIKPGPLLLMACLLNFLQFHLNLSAQRHARKQQQQLSH